MSSTAASSRTLEHNRTPKSDSLERFRQSRVGLAVGAPRHTNPRECSKRFTPHAVAMYASRMAASTPQ